METAERYSRTAIELLERLSSPSRSRAGFFPAVRLLERLLEADVRIGGTGPFSGEAIRFSHEESMMSQPNEVSAIKAHPRFNKGVQLERTQWVYEVVTCILGLTGTDSPLPLYMVSEFVQDEPSAALQREFLDLFHNRLTALFYRAITKYDFASEALSDGSDNLTTRALQPAGFDVAAGRPESFTPIQLLHVAALFAAGPATARSLQNSMRTLLATPLGDAELTVEQFTGGWVRLDPSQHNSLGRANHTPALNFVIGSRIRHPANEARIVVRTLAPARAREFAPGGEVFSRLRSLVATLSPSAATMKLELHVRTAAFPPFVLGKRRIAQDACITARRDRDGAVAIQLFDIDGAAC